MDGSYPRMADYLYVALGNRRKAVGVRFLFDRESYHASDASPIKGQMSYCSMVRMATMGRSHKAVADNFSCKGGARALGFTTPDEDYLSGAMYERLGIYKNIDVCKRVAHKIVYCRHNPYGIEIKPLELCSQNPHVVLLVLNTYQAMRVIQGHEYMNGTGVSFKTIGNQAVCSECTAHPFVHGGINVSLMCSGTRYNARWGDDELMLGISTNQVSAIIEGIFHTINVMDLDEKKIELEKRLSEKEIIFELQYQCNYFMPVKRDR